VTDSGFHESNSQMLKDIKRNTEKIMAAQDNINADTAQLVTAVASIQTDVTAIQAALAALPASVDTTALDAAVASLTTSVGTVTALVPPAPPAP
jgi:septal ring factor EnvC (AmiA/AmiB activator)